MASFTHLLVLLTVASYSAAQKRSSPHSFGDDFGFDFAFESQKFGQDFDADIDAQFKDLKSGGFPSFGKEDPHSGVGFDSFGNPDHSSHRQSTFFKDQDSPKKFATGFLNFPGIDISSEISAGLKESPISNLIPKKNEISYLPALHSSTFSGPKPDILSFEPVKGVEINFRPDEHEENSQKSFFDNFAAHHQRTHSFGEERKKTYDSPPKREVSYSPKQRESYQPPVYRPQVNTKVQGDPYKQGSPLSGYEPVPAKPQYSYKTQGPIKASHAPINPLPYQPEVHSQSYKPPGKSISSGKKEIRILQPVYAQQQSTGNLGYKEPVHFDDGFKSGLQHQDQYHDPNPYHDVKSNIPGEPGRDYPIYNEVPYTDFTCSGVPYRPGMYANVETGCQAYHVCHDQRYGEQGAGFLCTNGTVFNQATFSCDWWYNVDCKNSLSLYELNADPKYNPYYQPPYEGPLNLPTYEGPVHHGNPAPSYQGPAHHGNLSPSYQGPPHPIPSYREDAPTQSHFQGTPYQNPSTASFQSSFSPFKRTQRDSDQQLGEMKHTKFEDLPPFTSLDSKYDSLLERN